MLFVVATTMTAAAQMVPQFIEATRRGAWSPLKGTLNIGLTVFVIACVLALLLIAVGRWLAVLRGVAEPKRLPVQEP
jgi:hypothetical protein